MQTALANSWWNPTAVLNARQLSLNLSTLVPISLAVAILLGSSSLSLGQAKTPRKDYVYELQYWEWEVDKAAAMKDINLEDIPKNAKLTSVKILRQVDSMNHGVVEVSGLEISYFVLPDEPEEKNGEVKSTQVYLSVSKQDDTGSTHSADIHLPTMKLGVRKFLGGNFSERQRKANVFTLVITESKKNIIQIWNDLPKLGSVDGP